MFFNVNKPSAQEDVYTRMTLTRMVSETHKNHNTAQTVQYLLRKVGLFIVAGSFTGTAGKQAFKSNEKQGHLCMESHLKSLIAIQ